MTDLRHVTTEELRAELDRRQVQILQSDVRKKREQAEEEDAEAIIARRLAKTFKKPTVV